jgi:hypothetical protein
MFNCLCLWLFRRNNDWSESARAWTLNDDAKSSAVNENFRKSSNAVLFLNRNGVCFLFCVCVR